MSRKGVRGLGRVGAGSDQSAQSLIGSEEASWDASGRVTANERVDQTSRRGGATVRSGVASLESGVDGKTIMSEKE